MKKKNLKVLLALIAALALVFAAGCDTSGDSASGNGGGGGENGSPTDYAADYYSTEWTAEESIVRTNTANVEGSDVSIEKATIAFGTSTSSATLTLVFTEEASTLAEDTYTQWTKELSISSWSADESGNVAITLPTGADDSDNVAGLNLTLSGSTLTLASVTYVTGTEGTPAASYTVSLEGLEGVDGSTNGGAGDISASSSLDIFSDSDIDGLGVFAVDTTAFTKESD